MAQSLIILMDTGNDEMYALAGLVFDDRQTVYPMGKIRPKIMN